MTTNSIRLGFVGEVLLDVVVGVGTGGSGDLFAVTSRLGGAPVNAAVVAAQLSSDAQVFPICSVGDDEIGRTVKSELLAFGLQTASVSTLPGRTTSVAMYPVRDDGEESWSVYHRDADIYLPQLADIQPIVDSLDVIVFGAPSLSVDETRLAVHSLLRSRSESSVVIFDANYRNSMWPSEESYRDAVSGVADYVDVFKFNLLEARLLTDCLGSVAEIVDATKRRLDQTVFLTLGSLGCALISRQETLWSSVDPVAGSPIGAGDAFVGALAVGLPLIRRTPTASPLTSALHILAGFANRCGRVANLSLAPCAHDLKPLYQAEYATFQRAMAGIE